MPGRDARARGGGAGVVTAYVHPGRDRHAVMLPHRCLVRSVDLKLGAVGQDRVPEPGPLGDVLGTIRCNEELVGCFG